MQCRLQSLSSICGEVGHLLLDKFGVLDAGVHEHGGGGKKAGEVHRAPAVFERRQVEGVRVEYAADPLNGVFVQFVDLGVEHGHVDVCHL